jgi:PAS domain S-box-containing protein
LGHGRIDIMHNKEKSSEDLFKKVRELQAENDDLKKKIKSSLNENQLNLILENAGEGILGLDLNGNHVFVNSKAALLLGFEQDELIGRNSHSLWHHSNQDGSKLAVEECPIYFTLKDGKIHSGEGYFWRKDGDGFYVDFSSLPIRDNGLITGAVISFSDITFRKQSEKKQKLSEELFRKAFITSPDSVNINRLSDGMFVSINEGFTKILGYSEEDVIGKTSVELNIWADPEYRNRLAGELLKTGRVESFEAQFRHKNGTIIDGLMSASLIELEGVAHILNITKDITERKKIEDAFKSERFLTNALMDNLPDHIFFKDMDSKFIRNNKAHALSFGLENPAELIGKSDFDFFTKEAAQRAFEDEQTIIKTGKLISKEEKLTRKNQSDVWFSVVKIPMYNAYNNIVGTFGISRDITKQKNAEETLKQSEARFRSVAQSANDAIITVNSRGNIQGWNHGAEIAFGYSEEEMIGKSLNLVIPDEYLHKHIKAKVLLEMRGEKHDGYKTVELLGLRKDGNTFPLELSLSDWKTSEGKFFTGIIRDITIRKRTELENQVLYEITQGITTTSNLDDLMKLIHSSLQKVVYAENFFVALFDTDTGLFSFPYFVDKYDETPLPTAMAKSCSAYVYRTVKPFLFSQEIFNFLIEQGEVEQVGSESPSWIGIPLQIPSKIMGVMVLQHYEKQNVYSENDVRFLSSIGNQIAIAIERKKTEEEIKLKNELLQTINAEKDKFFSILAHDLRGPLSAFVAATQILTEEIQTMEMEEVKDLTMSMKTSASNIYSLLENLLEWSRLMRGGLDFIPEKLNLHRILNASIDVISLSAVKKGVAIDVSIPDDLEVTVDNHMFDTIIRNLVSNAVKFTAQGGMVSVSASLMTDKSVEIKVTDSGIGMTDELRNKLFKISEKSSRLGTDGEPSSGLGLLLVKEFIEKHGGNLWVESEVGKGSTFSFIIPAANR